MISVVVPRPIAFISTVGGDGRHNVAPFSYYTALTNQPPLLGVSINARRGTTKDTLRNIQESGDFVINVVDEALLDRAVQASGEWPAEVDEFVLTGLTPVASERVRSPRVAESPVSLECRLDRVIELGNTHFVIGEILWAHVRDEVVTEGRVDPLKLRPVGRLGGEGYAPLREVLQRSRPRVPPPAS
jgi:flavin reductase (DIM6/NTAB) family NADH-FMN oxidoreductase RutF